MIYIAPVCCYPTANYVLILLTGVRVGIWYTGRLPTGSLQDQGSGNPVRCTGPQALQRASTSGALDLRSDTQPHNRYTGPRNRQADLYTSGKTYTFDRYCHAVTGAAFGSGISNALYPIYRTGAGCRSGFRTPGPVDWSWGAAL